MIASAPIMSPHAQPPERAAPLPSADGTARLQLLYELACAFAALVDLDALSALVVAKCRDLLDAEGAAILLLDPQRDELFFPYVDDADPAVAARLLRLRFPADRGIAGAVLRDGRALRIDDVANDPRFYGGVDARSGLVTRSLLCAPLNSRQGRIGVIQVLNRRDGRGFSDDDLIFLETLAASVAVAIDNARLYTQLRASAAQLAEYNRTLEGRVDERTRDLRDKNRELEAALLRLTTAQQQLIVQEKLASLGALTAGVAHEIKNPLNFITNFAQLSGELATELRASLALHRGKLDAEVLADLDQTLADLQQNVRKIDEHGKRADRIVRGMLAHSRGKPGTREVADLNALVADYVNLAYHGLRSQDPSCHVTLHAEYDPAVGDVPVVAQSISRAFLNLINNACYAARERQKKLRDAGGDGSFAPTVWVRTKDIGDAVEIRIRDNGAGVPAAIREKVFEPFFTTKPPGAGTGLGLSITYEVVVKEHHGELRVESEEGSHAEFIVVLPKQAP